jgi:hypothetical protein
MPSYAPFALELAPALAFFVASPCLYSTDGPFELSAVAHEEASSAARIRSGSAFERATLRGRDGAAARRRHSSSRLIFDSSVVKIPCAFNL